MLLDEQEIDLNAPTIDQVKLILKKCTDVENAKGFEFFLKTFVYSPHPTKGKIRFGDDIYDWQERAAVEFLQNKFIISRKQRQVGFSTLASAYVLWRSLFFPNQTIVVISIGQRESADFLERVYFSYERLPVWLRTPTKEYAKTSLSFDNGSKVRSLPNGPNVARGLSGSLIILDEFAFYGDNAKKILAAAVPALGMGLKTPFTSKTLPSQLFIISTLPEVPIENEYMRILNETREQKNEDFHIIEVTVDDIPEYQDPEWHSQMKAALGEKRYRIEILCEEQNSLENSFLPSYILDDLKSITAVRTDFLHAKQVDEEGYPKELTEFYNYREGYDKEHQYIKGLWIFYEPRPGHEYGIAADVATGRAGDYSAFHVFDLESYEQVAEYQAKINTEDYKEILYAVALHYNNAKLSVESNSMGESICQYFGNTLMYENFYWTRKTKRNTAPGFYLGSNRGNVLAILEQIMVKKEIKINSTRLINELRVFGWTSQGRAEALTGNDDLVMALAQFCFLKEQWFCTTKNMLSTMLYDNLKDVIQKIENDEELARKRHYMSSAMSDVELTEDSKLIMGMVKGTGYSLPVEDQERMMGY